MKDTFRHLLKSLTRSWVIRWRLPRRCGSRSIFVSSDSALQYLKPNLERSSSGLFDIASNFVKAGNVVWDVGANVGMFAIAAANKSESDGFVLAIEADPFLASLLQKSVNLPANRDINVSVLCAAAADCFGVARFLISKKGRSSNSLEQSARQTAAENTRFVQYVPTITLDALLDAFPPPNFVKIDVEGAEQLVLEGAEKILTTCRPSWYIEVGREQNSSVTSILQRTDYVLYNGDGSDLKPIDRCAWNTLAIPREKADSVPVETPNS